MDTEVADFLAFCRVERRLAELTCKAYERDVRACLRFLRTAGISSWAEVRPPELRRFLAAETERRPALASQARTVAALKGFFRFLVENEQLERDPAHVLRTPKKREALPDVLDRRERDRLPLALFAYAGLQATPARTDVALVGAAGQLREAALNPAKDKEIGNFGVHRDLPGHADGPWSRK